MTAKIEKEILQLISSTWLDSPNRNLSSNYVIRYWSIDTQWMNYTQAEKLVDELVEKGWLTSIDSSLKTNIRVDADSIKFGWIPEIKYLNNLPKNNEMIDGTNLKQISNETSSIEDSIQIALDSPQRRLVRYISANTGILKDEIIRRCARKKRSLGQITTTFCLLLIAKEQGMDMPELIMGIET